ncbi:ATP-dependent helicase [Pseudobutyrivibrio xylanivorans]|uniref:DNA 3'-5' helicase n=1 Tax=Pseudobutyrivibrio xylanivorans DSM 14809 TaxID=1123012 RepID=A0A1M6IZ67_PSEXY|nr:ATP-dependent helicase [Pseudobutyrivibrio xylanivorans]SHJ39755.1 DNA helicase-2 / ATP-dependent DNA helicase PcrA [Pseudobutyrivibrio xylanivorans DSM 14809]
MLEKQFIELYTSQLNEQQMEAVRTVEGPVLLLAVPGSGKTTVLVNRLGYMIYCKGIAPENILTLTYTVAATKDMANRFEKIFGPDLSDRLEFRTINGICSKVIAYYGRMIGKNSFELLTDEKEIIRLLSSIYLNVEGEYPTESDIKNIRTLITYCKNMYLTGDEIDKLGKDEDINLRKIYEAYNNELKNHSLMDYDDQMLYAYRILKGSPVVLNYYRKMYKYICVDEAQDTSKIQHMIISLLSGESGNLFMVGDEDQSIYGFRAAYPDALLNFERNHVGAKVLVMDKNYRSNAKIVEAADIFIQHNKDRHKKHICATKDAKSEISFVKIDREKQYSYLVKVAENVNTKTAVLYRDNESVLPLVDALERQSVSYNIKNVDMAFFTNRVVIDIINMLQFAFVPMDAELFMKIYFKFQLYLSKKDAIEMCELAERNHSDVLDAIELLNLKGHVLGNCKSLRTHYRNMVDETPYKAINRIENFMGYGDYLNDNNIDTNKIFILKMLAKKEKDIPSFLNRLNELRRILMEKKNDSSSKLILSTIHSSKGLEYDSVILMDVINGVFPNKVLRANTKATPQEKRDYEEERRIFYVGMTRAKDKLTIFKYENRNSTFINELKPETKNAEIENKASYSATKVTSYFKQPKVTSKGNESAPDRLIIGQVVSQKKYGKGAITDVILSDDGQPEKFSVQFESGVEKDFMFPNAFSYGMKIMD